ncbi:Biotin-(acetyl-CoA carboxylase) ligase [Salinihabitans flavidus]|uniref:Biotin-(Acetyl-CoA carboxylase) ligase n=1 Tax=Salinihabitans flavidus TaxID=569882 RepID=A0A1H8PRR2_9RHOB|nr:biotin/lipoate--protein ligase family protein [Salinihabitans flavidus]SEO44699.1 Biotin-(acetyl-CoA carboxylase) ligase [Salinihabitans flavidus]
MNLTPQFPPLIKGLAAGPANPLQIACTEAARGTDAGLLPWSITDDRLRAALVLAPEEPLARSAAGFLACAVGLQNALGVLVPPETAVHLEWSGSLRINGGHAGGLRLIGATTDPDTTPNWLVVSLELTLSLPDSDRMEPGQTPDWTSLAQEGCDDLDAVSLLEGWARHSLRWLHELDQPQGRANLYRQWRELVWHLGEETQVTIPGERLQGTFLGVDEDFGMLIKPAEGNARLIPLSALVEKD